MKRVFKLSILLAMMTIAGCNKENSDDGKGVGTLTINGISYTITDCCFAITKTGYNSLHFQNGGNNGVNHVNITLIPNELSSKTYTELDSDIVGVGIWIDEETNYNGIKDFQMVVNKSGKTYEVTISGKALVNEESQEFYDYSVTFKGKIRVEKEK